jgi:hypothetical protein
LKELLMPDLDQIKQGEQAARDRRGLAKGRNVVISQGAARKPQVFRWHS